MLLESEVKPPGSGFITVARFKQGDVKVTSLVVLVCCSSEVLSVEPDPEPVDDFLNLFLKRFVKFINSYEVTRTFYLLDVGDRAHGETDCLCFVSTFQLGSADNNSAGSPLPPCDLVRD